MPLPKEALDKLKRDALRNSSRNLMILSEQEYGPELGGRVAITTGLDRDRLMPGDLTKQRDPLTGNTETNIEEQIEIFSSPQEYQQQMSEKLKKHRDADNPAQMDVVKGNKIFLLNKEQSREEISRIKQGEKPAYPQMVAQTLKNFDLSSDIRNNQITDDQVQRKQGLLNLTTAFQESVRGLFKTPTALLGSKPEETTQHFENAWTALKDEADLVSEASKEGRGMSKLLMDFAGGFEVAAENTISFGQSMIINMARDLLDIGEYDKMTRKNQKSYTGIAGLMNSPIGQALPGIDNPKEIARQVVEDTARGFRMQAGIPTEDDLTIEVNGEVKAKLEPGETFFGMGAYPIARDLIALERNSDTAKGVMDVMEAPLRMMATPIAAAMMALDAAGEGMGMVTGDRGFSDAIDSDQIVSNLQNASTGSLLQLGALIGSEPTTVLDTVIAQPVHRAYALKHMDNAIQRVADAGPKSMIEAKKILRDELEKDISEAIDPELENVSSRWQRLWKERDKQAVLNKSMDLIKAIDEKRKRVFASNRAQQLKERAGEGFAVTEESLVDLVDNERNLADSIREAGNSVRNRADRIQNVAEEIESHEGMNSLKQLVEDSGVEIRDPHKIWPSLDLERAYQYPHGETGQMRTHIMESVNGGRKVFSKTIEEFTNAVLKNREKLPDELVTKIKATRARGTRAQTMIDRGLEYESRGKSPEQTSVIREDYQGYKRLLNNSKDDLLTRLKSSDTFDTKGRAELQFMDELAKTTGEVLHANTVKPKHVSGVMDEFLLSEKAAQTKKDILGAIKGGAEELTRMDFSGSPELARAVSSDALDEIFPFLSDNPKLRQQLSEYASEHITGEDVALKTGTRPQKTGEMYEQAKGRITTDRPLPAEPNSVAGRVKPFMDIAKSLKEGKLREVVPGNAADSVKDVTMPKVVSAISDSIKDLRKTRDLSDDVTGKIIPEDSTVSHTVEGLSYMKTADEQLSRKLGNVIKGAADKYVTGDFRPADLITDFNEQVHQSFIGEVQDPELAALLTRDMDRASPRTEAQMFDFLKGKQQVKNVTDTVDAIHKNIGRAVEGRQPFSANEMTIAEYIRQGQPEDVTPAYPTYDSHTQKVKRYGELNESGQLGLRRSAEIDGTKALIRENVGDTTHLEGGVLDLIEEELAGQKVQNGKHMLMARSMKDHPDWGDALKGVDDPMAQKVAGQLFDHGNLELLDQLKGNGIIEDGQMNWENILDNRQGIAANLPRKEARTLLAMQYSDMAIPKARRLARQGYHQRLSKEFDTRTKNYRRQARIRELKEQFPEWEEKLDTLEGNLEKLNSEEYLGMDSAEVRAADEVKKQYDNANELVNDTDLPDMIKGKLKGKIAIDDTGVMVDMIEELVKSNDDLHGAAIRKHARRVHGDNIENLNAEQLSEVVDHVKANRREDYMALKKSYPDEVEVEVRRRMGESMGDAKASAESMERWERAKEDTVKGGGDDGDRGSGGSGDGSGGGGGDGGGGGTGEGPPQGPLNDPRELVEQAEGDGERVVDLTPLTGKGPTRFDYVWDSIGRSVETALRGYGKEGQAIADLIEAMKSNQLKLVKKYNDQLEGIFMTARENNIMKDGIMENLWDSLDKSTKKDMQKAIDDGKALARKEAGEQGAQAFDQVRNEIRDWTDARAEELEAAGIKVSAYRDGEWKTLPFEKVDGYMPRMLHPDIEFRPEKINEIRKELEKKHPAEKVETFMQMLVEKTADYKKANIDYSRMLDDFTEELFLKDPEKALRLYAHDTGRRLAEIETLGHELDELYGGPIEEGLMDLIEERHGAAAYDHVDDLVNNALRGETNSDMFSKGFAETSANARKVLSAMYLQQAFIPNSTQWLFGSILSSESPSAIFKAVDSKLKNAEIEKGTTFNEAILESGYDARQLMRHTMNNLSKDNWLNSIVSTSLWPFKQSEMFTRHMSAGIGLENFNYLVREFKKEIKKGATRGNLTPRAKLLKEKMRDNGIRDGLEFGRNAAIPNQKLDIFEIADRGYLNEWERSLVMNRWNAKTNFSSDPFRTPVAWDTPLGKFVTMFKQFIFGWGKLIKDTMRKPIAQRMKTVSKGSRADALLRSIPGYAGTVGAFAMAGIPIGFLHQTTRAMMNGRDTETYNDGIATYLGEVGGMGIAGNILDSLEWGRSVPEIIAGVPGSEAKDVVDLFRNGSVEEAGVHAAEKMTQAIPFIGAAMVSRLFRGEEQITTFGQVANRLSQPEKWAAIPSPALKGEPIYGQPRDKEFFSNPNNIERLRNKYRRMLNEIWNVSAGEATGIEFETSMERMQNEQAKPEQGLDEAELQLQELIDEYSE